MKIGIFDSGIGGLTVLKEVSRLLPKYHYLYLADSAHFPYGEKRHEETFELTKKGVSWLFSKGAGLVILACNTASSQALRRLQQEWLPISFPDRKVLGVLIPVAQEIASSQARLIGVIGTKATVASQAYIRELRKVNHRLNVIQVGAPLLVDLIEKAEEKDKIRQALEMYLTPLKLAGIESLILGCTHYPLLLDEIQEIIGGDVCIPHPGKIVAQKLVLYLQKHPEIERQLETSGMQEFFTSGDPEQFIRLSQRFFGKKIAAQRVPLIGEEKL